MWPVLRILTKPWVLAAGSGLSAYYLLKKNRDTGHRLKEAKIELIEQQRTIDRLRAEVGRERHQRLEGSDRVY